MALKKTLKLTNNFGTKSEFPDAYIVVDQIQGNKDFINLEVVIRSAPQGRFLHRISSEFIPDMEGSNFIKQAYEHLKTLPEFEGAVDA